MITNDNLIEKVTEFETLLKEHRKLRAWPTYRDEKGEEYLSKISKDFSRLRQALIDFFKIKGQNYNHGLGLDRYQLAERTITTEYAQKWLKKKSAN